MSSAKFPKLPNGTEITTLISNGLEMGKKELKKAMYQKEEWCDSWAPPGEKPSCNTWERGLREDIKRAYRDLDRGLEDFGIQGGLKLWDQKFITDLIEAEYSDFVSQFNRYKGDIARDLDRNIEGTIRSAERMNLAQRRGGGGGRSSGGRSTRTTTVVVGPAAADPNAGPVIIGGPTLNYALYDEKNGRCWNIVLDQQN